MSKALFGVEFHQYLDAGTILEEVRLAERLGYDSIWLGDSQLIWREAHVLLGAAAQVTARAALGLGVTNPVTRHPTVTASAMATLQELSGGRAILGMGVGATSVRTMGLPPVTRAELARYVATVRALGEGEAVPARVGEMRLAFGARGKGPPIFVGGSGPKMLRLAGEIGDGAIVTGRARPGETLRAMLGCVEAGRAAAGRQDRPFTVCLGVSAAVDRDRARALAAVRPHVAASGLAHPQWELDEAARRASAVVQKVYTAYNHMNPDTDYAALIPDEVVSQFAIAGMPEECVEQVDSLFAAGIDEITIRPYAVQGSTRAAMVEAFAREVMSRSRARR